MNKKPLQVLLVDHTSLIGGAEISLEALVTHMPRDFCLYTVAVPGNGPLIKRLKQRSISVRQLSMQGWRWWWTSRIEYLKFFLTFPLQIISLWRWVNLLRELHPDLVHFNINRLIEPVLATWLLGIPSIMHFRDIPSRMDLNFVLGEPGFYKIMNLAIGWIANSSVTEKDIHPHTFHPVFTIPNAIDLVEIDSLKNQQRDHLLVNKTSYIVVMVALLVPLKNHPAFLRLAQYISTKRDDVVFWCAGTGEERYLSELRQMARQFGLDDRVKFLGFVDNIPYMLNQADLLVHTTGNESFGRVFIEAMACRRPIVAINNGGATEIVVDGETGFLTPDGDIPAMAAAVNRLLDDPVLRMKMGEAGRQRVEKYYTIEKHCEAINRVYTSLLKGKNDAIA